MILSRHLTPFASTMHERDDLVLLQFIYVSILRCNSSMYQFSGLHFVHVYALASSPAVSGKESKILVPAELRTKTRFAAIKQTVNRLGHGRCSEQHSLVVARVTHRAPTPGTPTPATRALDPSYQSTGSNRCAGSIRQTRKPATRAQAWETRGSNAPNGSNGQTWRGRKRTVASWGITGPELDRLSAAVRFMQLHCHSSRTSLWLLTTDPDTPRALIADIWKRITRYQGDCRLHCYSVAAFESRGGLHAHIVFIGTPEIARRLKASDQFGRLIDVCPVTDSNGLARKYLAKERTSQAGYKRDYMFGGRITGSHRLPGGGDRVRLSRQLERDAIDAGYVRPWQRTNAKRKPNSSCGRGCQ